MEQTIKQSLKQMTKLKDIIDKKDKPKKKLKQNQIFELPKKNKKLVYGKKK